ncbi:MAG TPA: hypothetical protein VFH68_12605 [Polyangia bacterium]|jgi:hypothetical protein|nr:hypothetical protein [Polyangia bacterium]
MNERKDQAITDDRQPTQDRAPADAHGAGELAFDIDEQPVLASGTRRLTERTDLLIAGLPRPEPRRVPFWARLRLIWHRQVLRDAG